MASPVYVLLGKALYWMPTSTIRPDSWLHVWNRLLLGPVLIFFLFIPVLTSYSCQKLFVAVSVLIWKDGLGRLANLPDLSVCNSCNELFLTLFYFLYREIPFLTWVYIAHYVFHFTGNNIYKRCFLLGTDHHRNCLYGWRKKSSLDGFAFIQCLGPFSTLLLSFCSKLHHVG